MTLERTIRDVVDEMSEEQKNLLYGWCGYIIEHPYDETPKADDSEKKIWKTLTKEQINVIMFLVEHTRRKVYIQEQLKEMGVL